ncbi:MAG: TetR/AcrR family transcriptional regulator [Bacteroidetes bacterium]|nr:TetR/AcrR family transcriptional regulator [Bacteroidota bacterium]
MLEKIIEGCEKLFRRYGIKSLSMDDIARELGMSKKTIYQYVTDKNDLVKKTFSSVLSCNEEKCNLLDKVAKNPVEEMLILTREVSQQMKGINSSVFYDMQKYHPEAWQMFNDFINSFVYNRVKINLQNGIEQGFYRTDINTEILSRIYITMMNLITDHERFGEQEYDFSTIYNEIIKYHFNAICTDKGFKIFNKN